MKKLIRGIVDFRQKVRPGCQETFARLALEQKPDSLFIACSDSRVVPNLFASTEPGDLFVIRNVGNLIPPCGEDGISVADESEAAAIEFAIANLDVTDIIVCGHSECGAMHAIHKGVEQVKAPHLRKWLRHGEPSLKKLEELPAEKRVHSPQNELSRANVLQQIEHLMSYSIVRERVAAGKLRLHGWWFEIAQANVHAYDPDRREFNVIDEKEAERLLKRLDIGRPVGCGPKSLRRSSGDPASFSISIS